MDNEQTDNQEKCSGKKSRLDKILVLPGIHEAIDLVRNRAWETAINKTIRKGFGGELYDELELIEQIDKGEISDEFKALCDELKSILESNGADTIDRLINHKLVASYISDSYEELCIEVVDKIAELWGLSESAARLISEVISSKEYPSIVRQKSFPTPVKLLLNAKDLKSNQAFAKRYHELAEQGITIYCNDQSPKGRIYLDVTELTTKQLRSVYKSIELCRDILEIQHEDLRAGAPKSFDTNKALAIDLLRMRGKSNVKIAKQLGFRTFKDYYLKDTAPRIFYKYKKLGKEINEKLEALYSYLVDLHSTTSD